MRKYDVAAYVWPAYTGDELRARMFWRDGMGEWQTVKNAKPRFEGHDFPRKPLWGYVNEADPKVMEMQIDAAASHGVNVFIYDWYWYDGRPFLENCLNDGFLKARNRDKMKFYVMWANHHANNLWNKELSDTEAGQTVIWRGDADRAEFEIIAERLINKYFVLDNYYKIDGNPVLMIYDLGVFVSSLGGIDGARDAIKFLREKAKEAGFDGVHIQIAGRKNEHINYSGVDGGVSVDHDKAMLEIGADSFTHYQFCHTLDIDRDYREIAADAARDWEEYDKLGLPYFPHVSVGWDNTSRFYNYIGGITKNNTPENFKAALRNAKRFLDARPDLPPLVTVNSWNEWTEGSYLQPDTLNGYGYLEAIKQVFTEK